MGTEVGVVVAADIVVCEGMLAGVSDTGDDVELRRVPQPTSIGKAISNMPMGLLISHLQSKLMKRESREALKSISDIITPVPLLVNLYHHTNGDHKSVDSP